MMPKRVTVRTLTLKTWWAKPIAKASGIVMAMVKRPQGLSARALTTTRPSTARRMVMIARIETMATRPTTGLTSSFSIWPTDFPPRRIEANMTMASWTPPPRVAPMRIQSMPGR
jgi:hypothetical protein